MLLIRILFCSSKVFLNSLKLLNNSLKYHPYDISINIQSATTGPNSRMLVHYETKFPKLLRPSLSRVCYKKHRLIK